MPPKGTAGPGESGSEDDGEAGAAGTGRGRTPTSSGGVHAMIAPKANKRQQLLANHKREEAALAAARAQGRHFQGGSGALGGQEPADVNQARLRRIRREDENKRAKREAIKLDRKRKEEDEIRHKKALQRLKAERNEQKEAHDSVKVRNAVRERWSGVGGPSGEWECAHCTCKNPAGVAICEACARSKDCPRVSAPDEADDESQSVEDQLTRQVMEQSQRLLREEEEELLRALALSLENHRAPITPSPSSFGGDLQRGTLDSKAAAPRTGSGRGAGLVEGSLNPLAAAADARAAAAAEQRAAYEAKRPEVRGGAMRTPEARPSAIEAGMPER